MLSSQTMPTSPTISLDTHIKSLHRFGIPTMGEITAKNLSDALESVSEMPAATAPTIEDLLNYLPIRYEDRSNLARISDLYDGLEASLELNVRVAGGFEVGKNRSPKQPRLFKFELTASDPERTAKPVLIWWFLSGRNAASIIAHHREKLTQGARFIAFGKWEWDERRNTFSLRLNKPDELEMLPGTFEIDDEDALEAGDTNDPAIETIHVGRRVPIYRKLGLFRTKRIRGIIHHVLSRLDSKLIAENLPADLRRRLRLIDRGDALRRIHFPSDKDSLAEYESARSPAHMRLIFEEFFWVALALGLRREERVKEPKGAAINIGRETRASLASVVPFSLTNAQERVLKQIFADMQSSAPMNRLLQGDVGCGKTIVALQAMMAAMENGYQTALMVPTEILAEQHAFNIKRLLSNTAYRVELLIGSLRASEKRRLQEDISLGNVHAVIGTQALIQDAVSFSNLGLVVIDEQHRFGVMQRAHLRALGFHPDVLVMTATPIPRSLAMTAYGDLDVSVIDELPPGRTPVKTVVLGEEERIGIYKGVKREVRLGHQVYVIYPLVEESEKMDLKDATGMYEHLRREFPDFKVDLLHGKMKSPDKEEIMRRFVAGEIQILVSTTVVEVGVDVPNASLMVIEHAERFGLSQLHQLRGRVGRGAEKSFCVLLASEKQTSVARERLGIMEETNDGFRIAEKDLEIRGPGELMGTRQAGLPIFHVGDLIRDRQILESARSEANYYLTTKRKTAETTNLVRRVKADPRFGLAAIG